jgi:hypothetical protein
MARCAAAVRKDHEFTTGRDTQRVPRIRRSYDESAGALNIHRNTLRYRLARIAQLTSYDIRDVDTRFNLHAATRSWRFLKRTG